MRPGDIVLMDNLRAPKSAGICEAIEQTGTQVVYLPPYSPEWLCLTVSQAPL